MNAIHRFLHELLVTALFDLATDPAKGFSTRIIARAVLATHDDGPIGRALRWSDASRSAPKSPAQS